MKLTCDICGAALQMNAGGQGAVCINCGVNYSTARLKEKLGAKTTAKPTTEEIIYDVVEYEIVGEKSPREMVRDVLVHEYGEKAVIPDALIGMDSANKADFLVRANGYSPIAISIVSGVSDEAAYENAVRVGQLWEKHGAYSIIFFEDHCKDPEIIRSWVSAAMEKASHHLMR